MSYTTNSHDVRAFLDQNPDSVADLNTADLDTLDQYAEHHAGGLYVLWRYIEDTEGKPEGLAVKMHDSWGGDDGQGRTIVVHVYSTEDDRHNVVNYYSTGTEALAAFLAADADTKEA